MLKRSLFYIFFLLPFVLLAQKDQGVSIVLGADYLLRSHKTISSVYENDPNLHFRVGADYSREITQHWALKTGLCFTHFRFDSGEGDNLVFEEIISPVFGGGGQTSGEFSDFRIRTTDYFVEIPLIARFYSSNSQRFYVEGGAAFNLYLGTFSKLEFGDNKQTDWRREHPQSVPELLPNLQLGLGYTWPNAKGHAIFVRPTFRYFLPSNGSLQMYSAGLEMGYRW